MTPARGSPPGCPLPSAGGDCLPECREAGTCRAEALLLVDGRTLHGRALGVLGDTLRFLSVFPVKGPVLLPFEEVEPLSLHEVLRASPGPLDAEILVRLAEAAADRGLVDLALRDLDRALEVSTGREASIRRSHDRILDVAARRGVNDALDHVAARRFDHARAALDEVLRRFPETESAAEAQRLRRSLVGAPA
jgi:hypothetical protein